MISFQKIGVRVEKLHQQMVHLFDMKSRVTVWIFQLAFVLWQQRARFVEIIFLGLVVKRQRIELAAQGFVVT